MSVKYEKTLRIREFKARQISRILEVKKKLMEKYPAKTPKIMEITNELILLTEKVKVFSLSKYLSTLYRYTVEFPELEEAIPPADEIEDLLS